MTRAELIEKLASQRTHLPVKLVDSIVKEVLDNIAQTLEKKGRVEIRGFGSFSLHYRVPRVGRNPKTGEKVTLTGKYAPYFKPGKELRERVNSQP